ncbi:hypothetical protein AALP_AA6G354700 [Arabis alpina]|uniref:F-box/LRR-repeat protein 15/At3g58940/PEG3-like LRR domain-containing protein n=1 Tax=Arabis alpina TaxID=50452 RepID=A0A087GTT0_ARAAL|nr:hypothetical protein AALP_AA6G354700 [Arabis alpina]
MSVLSKRWKSLWKMMPHLEFICKWTNDLERFSDNVCKTLLSHKAPVLQSLHVEIDSFDDPNMGTIGIMIGIAFGHHVRELVLHVCSAKTSFTFPRSLYNCETLETLVLSGLVRVHVPFPVCLKSLKTLHLHRVKYEDEESVVNLLSGCSSLENLLVNRFVFDDLKTFTIAVPSLQRLTLIDVNNDEDEDDDEDDDKDEMSSIYLINAPCLKYLRIKGFNKLGSILFENTPELVRANIDIKDEYNITNMSSVYKSASSSVFASNGVVYIPKDGVPKGN